MNPGDQIDQEFAPLAADRSSASVAPAEPTIVERHDPYIALRSRDFRLLTLASAVSALGTQMVSVAIGWQLYERTNSTLVLGYIGLVQVLPVIFFSLYAGHIADRYDRRRMVLITLLVMAFSSAGLAVLSYTQGSLLLIFACLFLVGLARAFYGPASGTLWPQTVPPEAMTNAATWSSSGWQLASVVGPMIGGFIIAVSLSATPVYVLDMVALLICGLLVALVKSRPVERSQESQLQQSQESPLQSILAGVRFVWSTQIILAAITLDLFAVLLGGATALLPVFARDILQVGPAGLGWLRAAPSIGALAMAFALAYLPPFKSAGKMLLWAVGGFGIATVVFGISHSFWLSLTMLMVLGALDNISVVIRTSLVLLRTPDEMRGRINAVNSIFIGASNELGAFESGLAATFLGPITAVAAGGIGTVLVVLLVALIWPEMRRLGRLTEVAQ